MMRQGLYFGLLALALLGCGADRGVAPKSAKTPIETLVVTDEPPAAYALADGDCQAQAEPIPLTRARIHTWDGSEVKARRVAFADARSDASLVSPAVRLTTYDDLYQRVCDFKKGTGRYCQDERGQELSWSLDRTARPLRICKDGADFPRLTFERVGLASLHGIEVASAAYLAADRGAHPLEPIHLSVLPHFVDLYRNYEHDGQIKTLKTWVTHNMAYFPSAEMIAVFPEPASLQPSLEGFFWESEFVLAHEYGHHVELTRLTPAAAAFGLTWSPLRHVYLGVSGEPTEAAQVFGSFSEAFADLLAYYAQRGDTSTLVGLPCFGANRDPGRGTFGNGDEKTLTEDRLALLLGQVGEEEKPCGEPRYSDIHNTGAIVATLLDEAFAALTLSSGDIVASSAEDFSKRYELALAWQDALTVRARQVRAAASAQELLALLPAALEDATEHFLAGSSLTDGQGEAARRAVCEVVSQRLPVVERLPFAC
jgi:hypothetical protein